MKTIKTLIFLIYSCSLLSGGIYLGWQTNTLYSQITQNPLGFLANMGEK